MGIVRKIVLISFLSIGVFSSLSLVAQDSIMYSFFVAGHTYGNPLNHTLGLYDQLKKRFPYIKSRKEIKFGVFTGDIVKHPSAEAWDSVDADISKLGLPVYFAVGNHDMYKRNLFEQRYGKTYYYFVYNNDLFIILDPNLEAWNISQEQLDMINTALNENLNKIDNIFVFFHQVLWWSPDNMYSNIHTNSTEGRADTINFWTDVEPFLRII